MKITYDDAAYILNYQKQHWFQKLFCTYTVTPIEDEMYMITCNIKIPVYVMLVIPYFIFSIFWCIWETGLKNGEYLLSRRTHEYYATKYDYASDRIRERFPLIDGENK